MSGNRHFFAKTPRGYVHCRLNSVEELLRFTKSLKNSRRFIYRGQADAEWKLETRIERDVPDGFKETVSLTKLEQAVLRQFQERAHLHLPAQEMPNGDAFVEWLAFIQHYGGPTRLLDFTHSPFVAAHFAVATNTSKRSAAIWAVNHHFADLNRPKRISEYASQLEDVKVLRNDEFASGQRLLKELAGVGPPEMLRKSICGTVALPATVTIAPSRYNRRLLNQQGVFIAPLDADKSFESNLSPMFEPTVDFGRCAGDPIDVADLEDPDRYSVIKFVIEPPAFPAFRSDLRRMNIATEILFPDLEGEARALCDLVIDRVFVQGYVNELLDCGRTERADSDTLP